MYRLAKIMALFWTLAEGMIFLYLRWGYLKIRGGHSNQRAWVILFSMVFCGLALWMLIEDVLAHRILSDTRYVTLHRWGNWNLFCTLWVGLEGAIMIYVIRIYRLLLSRTGGRTRTAAIIVWPLSSLFILYHFALFATALNHGMPAMEIYHVSVFYVRICGLLWIIFEGVVAIYGLKTYALLKQGAKTIHGHH